MSMPTEPTQPAATPRNNVLLLQGVVLGAVYGLLLRAAIGDFGHKPGWLSSTYGNAGAAIMTWGFLALGPLVIGFLTVSRAEAITRIPIWKQIFLPWVAVFLMMFAAALFSWEGAICIVMAIPIALFFSSVGGLAAGVYTRNVKPSRTTLGCVALLPFLIAPLESHIATQDQTRTVSSQILIHAPAGVIWQNVERVPAIAPSELSPSWAQRIGFPRPVEATLSYEGVGGVRHATFERGLLFVETVTDWQPLHRLAFTIRADSQHIPTTTLDEHVTIGGRYFDVLDGEYRLEPLANGDTLLHLTSHERLSTDLNGYAGLWTDAVMQNLQTSILEVIQHRCERE